MYYDFDGVKVRIPKGYHETDVTGLYVNNHGVEYGIIKYGRDAEAGYYLEAISDTYSRMVKCEVIH
jgi:hypothetical protein